MGAVRFGAPTDLIQQLAARFGIQNFVETGTYLGGTSSWAATQFRSVWTSELHPDSFARARETLEKFSNVRIYNEPSPVFLPQVLQDIKGKTFFWLDAHMMPGPVSAGHDDECPVLAEIRSILAWSKLDGYIFIDDARLFLAPAAPPHKADQWPSIREVLDALEPTRESHHIIVSDDIVMVVPLEARDFLTEYCRTEGQKKKESERRGSTMMLEGARQTIRGMARTAKTVLQSVRELGKR